MKLRHQYLLALIASALLAAILMGVGAVRLLHDVVLDRSREQIRVESNLLKWSIEERLALGTPMAQEDLQRFAVAAGNRLGHRLTLIADDGVVLADSARTLDNLAELDNHGERPEVRGARGAGSGESVRTSATTGTEYVYRAVRIDIPGSVRYLRVAMPVDRVREEQTRYAALVTGVALVAIGLLSAIAYGTVRRLSKPIESITDAAERIAAGDFSCEIPSVGVGEATRLSASVRRMKSRLERKFVDIDTERELLASVVSGIREGLLLIGTDHRVRMANATFARVFGIDFDPTGRLVAEIVRHPEVLDMLEEAIDRTDGIAETTIHAPDTGRSFAVRVTPLATEPGGRGGALALFFDVTRSEALERVRREFVANVSHELRTPLTSIRASVETLLDGGVDDHEDRRQFLAVIERQAGHMGDLVDDLTELSRIETGAVDLKREACDLATLAGEVVAEVATRAEAAEVRVENGIPEGLVAWVDRRRMRQVLVNLVDNAVKFHRPGGSVRIEGARVEDTVRIEVSDDGYGIPSESLPRIFNRFYRVDRARSKETPGTGLGLAIVKHLARLHGGRVEVASELGSGSTFSVSVPIRP